MGTPVKVGNLRFIDEPRGKLKDEEAKTEVIRGDEAEKIMFFFTKEVNDEVEKYHLNIERHPTPPEIRVSGKVEDKNVLASVVERWKSLVSDKLENRAIHGNCEQSFENVKRIIKTHKLTAKVLPIQSETKKELVRIFSRDVLDLNDVENAYENPKNILAEYPSSSAVASVKQRSYKGKQEEEKLGSFKQIESDVKYQFRTKQGLIIKLYKKPITRLNVDAIVNAANDMLANIGGVAEVIEKAAGPRMKKECEIIIRRKGKILDGLNVITTAGDLHYKGVIHAVGPRWHDSNYTEKSSCLNVLSTTIFNILESAEHEGYRTVAMPPISSGIFAVPKEMCAAMYLKGIFEFSEQNKFASLQEFHIIDINDEVLEMVEKWHKKFTDNPRCLDVNSVCRQTGQGGNRFSGSYGKGENKGRHRSENASRFSDSRKGHDKRDVKYDHGTRDDVKYDHDGHAIIVSKDKDKFILRFDKTDIHIYKADVLKLRNIDVIAVSEDPEISGKGALSRVLLDAGDEKYRSDHKGLRRLIGKHSTGKVLMTTAGGNFSFRHVLHAVIRRQGENTENMFQKSLQQTFSQILDSANKLGCPNKETRRRHGITLALPLLGTGTHKDKETILKCAWTAYEAISKFLLATKEVNITEIHLIDNNEYIIKNVEAAFVPSGSGRHPPLTPKPDFNKHPKEQYEAPKGKRISIWKMDTQDQKKADFSEFMKSRSKQAKIGNLVIHGDDDEMPVGDENCVICLCEFDDPVELTKCNHVFCKECITEVFRSKPSCPVCTTVYGVVFGDQPREGKATIYEEEDPLPGYREKTYVIYYEFESGVQKDFHPKPKTPYDGMKRRAFLPKTREGTEVLELLENAFKQGLTFTIGTSRTTGKEGVITWNDIHHKTSRTGGPQKFGYPDPGYLSRVKEELACKGITSDK
ncbi:DTX [Mytilus coruscus]|uniref:E3 ubiquitin-protein ligase n=1 Tax=Mytilus coruscus TaxID=42192 RepID=A0A6J8CFG1_MYTCO|nr:DTX [Mytilus coruscus]